MAQEVSLLNPQIFRVWAAFGFCFKSTTVKCLTASFELGEIKAIRKLLKMRKLRPKQHLSRFLPRPQFPLCCPTCQHSRRGYSLWPHPPDLGWLDPWSQLGHLHNLSKGFRTQLRNVHCSGLVSGPASALERVMELTFPFHSDSFLVSESSPLWDWVHFMTPLGFIKCSGCFQ